MTQAKDQERAEFEHEMSVLFLHTDFELHAEGHYKNPVTGTWFQIWQAARRTQKVPDEWVQLAKDCLKVFFYKGDYRSRDRRNHKLATITKLQKMLGDSNNHQTPCSKTK